MEAVFKPCQEKRKRKKKMQVKADSKDLPAAAMMMMMMTPPSSFLITGVWRTTWNRRRSCQEVTWEVTTRTQTGAASTRKRSSLKSFLLTKSCKTRSTRSTCEYPSGPPALSRESSRCLCHGWKGRV